MLGMFRYGCSYVGEIQKGDETFGVYLTKDHPSIVYLELNGILASKEDVEKLSSETPYEVQTSLVVKIDGQVISLLTKNGEVFAG